MPRFAGSPASVWPLIALFVVGTLILSGCDDHPAPSGEGAASIVPAAEESAPSRVKLNEVLGERVDTILAASDAATRETTATLPDGTVVPAREALPRRRVQYARAAWNGEAASAVETPGEIVRSWAPGEAPSLLLIDDAGSILLGGESVEIVSPDGSSERLADFEATVLQWNGEGTRLLAAGPERKVVFEWPDREIAAEFRPERVGGFLQFAPGGDGYWTLSDRLIFDASQETRVFWDVEFFESGPGDSRTLMKFRPFTRVGTLPALGTAWIQPIDSNRIVPESASLWELDADLVPARQLTSAGDSVDSWPVADTTQRLYFLRAPRFADGMIGRTTRAWMRDLNTEAKERQITGEPTMAVAVSLDGNRLALLVLRNGEAHLLRAATDDVLAQDLGEATAARRSFVAGVRALESDLRNALKKSDPEGPPEIALDGGEQTPWPRVETLDAAADALESGLRHRFGIELDGTVASLGRLDDFFQEADGLLTEEDAVVLGVAGCYARALASEEGIVQLPQSWTPALGTDAQAVTEGDEFLYTFHAFFYAARERIAGRLSLYETAVELLSDWNRPVLLTESSSSHTRNLWFVHQLSQAGFDFKSPPLAAFREAVVAAPGNSVINGMALEAVKQSPDDVLRLRAALNLAEANPASARALIEAANAVGRAGSADLQVRLCRQAELLAPDDPDILFDSATGHLDAWLLDEAEARFRRVLAIDATRELEDLVLDLLAQIGELRAEGIGQESQAP